MSDVAKRVRRPGVRGPLLLGLLCAGCAHLGHAEDPVQVIRGPIPAGQLHPVTQSFLAFRPRRAAVQPKGRLGVAVEGSYASHFTDDVDVPGDEVVFDGELLSADVRVRYGVGERTDLEVELPVHYATSGFLDDFIDDWHEAFGLGNGNRDARDQNQFEMRWEKDGRNIYEITEDTVGFGDVPIVLTHVLIVESETSPGLAVRAGIELPTGSESRGFSNGELDYGIGLLLERTRGRWTFTGAADFMVTGRPDAYRGTEADADDLFDLQLGVEYRWNDALSLVAQSIVMPPLESSIDLPHTNREMIDLAFGAAWDVGEDSFLTLTFHEDLVNEAGPDLALNLAWTWRM